jgi:hypothetical protein
MAKLTDTQLIVLSNAAARDDWIAVTLPSHFSSSQGGAAPSDPVDRAKVAAAANAML